MKLRILLWMTLLPGAALGEQIDFTRFLATMQSQTPAVPDHQRFAATEGAARLIVSAADGPLHASIQINDTVVLDRALAAYEQVEVPLRLKRFPLLASCVILWKLYRQGAYR